MSEVATTNFLGPSKRERVTITRGKNVGRDPLPRKSILSVTQISNESSFVMLSHNSEFIYHMIHLRIRTTSDMVPESSVALARKILRNRHLSSVGSQG